MFNLHLLNHEDYLQLNSLKTTALELQINNQVLDMIEAYLPDSDRGYLNYGIKFRLDAMFKKQCEADVFCTVLQSFYGDEFAFTLEGDV